MDTGRKISATTPWTMHSWELGVRSTMGDTIARPSPRVCHQSARPAPPRTSHRGPAAARHSFADSLPRPQRCAMELVNSVHQYTAIIEHCSNIIRAIVSIQADAFDCGTLYRTLCTSRCFTCNRFGDHLYLIDCRRVCYFCFTRRAEYFPLTSRKASKFFTPNAKPQSNAKSSRKLLELAKPPSILSLPGRYCGVWTTEKGGGLRSRRLQLYDRRTVVQSLAGSGLPQSDNISEPKRFMAIISAPVLLNAGRQVDHGFFCLGCMEETDEKIKHFRIKYTTEDMPEHIASYGRVERTPRIPGEFMHVTKDQITP